VITCTLNEVGGPLVATGHRSVTARWHVWAAKGPPTTLPPPADKLGEGATTGTCCIPGGTTTGRSWRGGGIGIAGGGAGITEVGAGIARGGPGLCGSRVAIRALLAFDSLLTFSMTALALPLLFWTMYKGPVVVYPRYWASGSSHNHSYITGTPGFIAL